LTASSTERIGISEGSSELRVPKEDYPYVQRMGNFILDRIIFLAFRPSKKESELKSIPGVLEVGLFTRRADVYYKAMHNGSFEIIKF
ncbi:MAG TPA: ribose-5-phosphate isomerase A, partial [Nitrososphaeraceae archaeon]|nr:ribose-5-phosphate isomerase A [Nitrososphaeraceae archaeon]